MPIDPQNTFLTVQAERALDEAREVDARRARGERLGALAGVPIGIKDVLTSGNIPVGWTNTKYKMLYMNMGHGDKVFSSPIQNRLIENEILWLLRKS